MHFRVVGLLTVLTLVACQKPAGQAGAVQVSPQTRATSVRDPFSGLPWISRAALPPEGRQTLQRIEAGGPFPYARDGVVFQNREGRLPRQPAGRYHEYTVRTPGSRDRGARRIICAAVPECYYTADHYASFARIRP
ncbi:ribonuclease domain-containing protein [Deinococcus sonorensis]|uniref:Ribonuclease domain-containing protein n=2 Tax=Deinococcus sonorensis TaxID=309891 RepID=A0AAU7UA96_9DEIO